MKDEQFLKNVGSRIREIRTKKNMSLLDVCANLNFDKPHLSLIESGKRNITLKSIKKIADALGVQPYELLK